MIRGVQSLAEQTARQRRGGLTTLARLGGDAMTAPARAGFRKRFEREALELAATQGRTLNQRQLDEATTALLRAHMALMTERRLKKRYELAEERKRQFPNFDKNFGNTFDSVEDLMADAERKALGDDPADTRAIRRVVEPVRLCVGCWVELCAGEAFPAEASSTLCARHLENYRLTMTGTMTGTMAQAQPFEVSTHDTQNEVTKTKRTRGATPPKQANKQPKPQTRRAPVLEHERSRDLNHRSLHQSH